MKLFDLSHPISPDMPVYPGTEPPSIITIHEIEKNGFLERKISFYTHTGTHVDAPSHLLKGGRSLDCFPVDAFFGKASRIDVPRHRGQLIDVSDLERCENAIAESDFVIFHTGWSQFWGTEKYFSGYPVLSENAVQWISAFRLKGVGFDTISADRSDSSDFPVHKRILERKWIIIENLANLDRLPCNRFVLCCFPLPVESLDGSPVRAVALVAQR
jgi:kynurenine formamidase